MAGFDELSIDNINQAELDFGRRRRPDGEIGSLMSYM